MGADRLMVAAAGRWASISIDLEYGRRRPRVVHGLLLWSVGANEQLELTLWRGQPVRLPVGAGRRILRR
jgi:hypothetical protein